MSWTVPGQTRVGWLIVLPLVAEISLSETNICKFSHQLAIGRITVFEPEENKLFTIFHFLQGLDFLYDSVSVINESHYKGFSMHWS